MTLQIIGAGFGRTGTSSLKMALEQLGLAPCYHMLEIAARPEHSALWLAADRGERIDWGKIFAPYSAAVDWPACVFWRELLVEYPAARVILTVRDRDPVRELSRHDSREARSLPLRSRALRFVRLYEVSNEVILQRTFRGLAADERRAIAALEAHNAAVIATVEPQRLLVYDVADGWNPPCSLLGVPVPAAAFRISTRERSFPPSCAAARPTCAANSRRRVSCDEPRRQPFQPVWEGCQHSARISPTPQPSAATPR